MSKELQGSLDARAEGMDPYRDCPVCDSSGRCTFACEIARPERAPEQLHGPAVVVAAIAHASSLKLDWGRFSEGQKSRRIRAMYVPVRAYQDTASEGGSIAAEPSQKAQPQKDPNHV